MTGGAFGSMAAQLFHLTSTERKTLLVAGAAGGMSATFASPSCSSHARRRIVVVRVEATKLDSRRAFERRGRCGSALSAGTGPAISGAATSSCCGSAKDCSFASSPASVRSACDNTDSRGVFFRGYFQKLPIHWMWWPTIGGMIIGLGGLIFPQALGVGYETIGDLIQGDVPGRIIVGVLIVKSAIWALSLGSGTSGGVLAPLLMIGGALGGVESMFFPTEGVGFWPLVSMGAVLGGTMRCPFTGIIFALELTHDFNAMFPLFIAVMAAYAFTVLVMKRSILTEKISRRGFHLSREYSIDPLEILFVREVMRTTIVAVPEEISIEDLLGRTQSRNSRLQHLYPVIDHEAKLTGVVTRKDLQKVMDRDLPLREAIKRTPVTAFPDEPLRVVVNRMAETGRTRMPVVERDNPGKLVGLVSLTDLLRARTRNLEEERRRERVLLRFPRALTRVS